TPMLKALGQNSAAKRRCIRKSSSITAATSASDRSKKSATCRRLTTSVWPWETGNASMMAIASSFSSSTRPGSRWQKEHSSLAESFIVLLDALFADCPQLRQIFRLQLPPQARLEPNERKIAIIPQVTTPLKLLEGHVEHNSLNLRIVQAIQFCHSGIGSFYGESSFFAIFVKPAELGHDLGEPRTTVVVHAIQDRKQHDRLVGS